MIGGGMSEDRGFSPQVAKLIDEEVSRFIEEGKTKAREVLTKYRGALDEISKRLVEVETMEREEYEALLKQHGVPINDEFEKIYGKLPDGDPSSVVSDTTMGADGK